MDETAQCGNHSYYPSIRHMVAHNKTGSLGIQKRASMELIISHDQLLDFGISRKTQQHQQPERCTICKDADGNTLFYRPYIDLHSLLQDSSLDDSSHEIFTAPQHSIDALAYQQSLFNSERDTTHVHNMNHDGISISIKDNNDDNDDDDNNTIHDNSMEDRTDRKDTSPVLDDAKSSGDHAFDSRYGDDLDQLGMVPTHQQKYTTLYNANDDSPTWSLIQHDGHTMTLISHQLPHKYTLMTTSTFSFVWEDDRQPLFLFPYQWQMQLADDGESLELLCVQSHPYQATKNPVALLDKQGTRLILFGKEDEARNLLEGGGCGTTTDSGLPAATAAPASAKTGIPRGDDSSRNPFRTTTLQENSSHHHHQRKIDSLDTFLVLSGLLLYDLIRSQLCALDNSTDAMRLMVERQQHALKKENDHFYKLYQQQQVTAGRMMMAVTDDELGTIHADKTRSYSNVQQVTMGGDGGSNLDRKGIHQDQHHGGGNNNNARWSSFSSSSSSGSLRSLELDSGLWQCWWGYGCWWHWLPFCMPGGWCDRACIKIRRVPRQHHHRSRVTRRMQGWQQQEEE
ncbi:unnamed protein product [Absidia cylindrospora]